MDELYNIKITDTGLFDIPKSNMYKFCLLNKIATVGELFEFVENYKFENGNPYANSEIMGIIDLLKYRYLYSRMAVDSTLNEKFIKHDYNVFSGKIDWYSSKQIKSFRRLGFTREEARLFILFSDKFDNELSVGECLIFFAENFNKNVPYQYKTYYETFKNKIALLLMYYKQYSKVYNSEETLKNLYNELKSMIVAKSKLEQDINNKKLEIERMLNIMSLNENKDVIKLRKEISYSCIE